MSRSLLHGKRLFLTNGSLMGFANYMIELGDEIWLADGLTVLLILRPVGQPQETSKVSSSQDASDARKKYRVISTCYLKAACPVVERMPMFLSRSCGSSDTLHGSGLPQPQMALCVGNVTIGLRQISISLRWTLVPTNSRPSINAYIWGTMAMQGVQHADL
jgi:hypothetical protein